jgi:TolA-binding protein
MKPFTLTDVFHSLDCDGLAKTVALYDLSQHTEILQQILKAQDEIDSLEKQHNELSEQLGELEAQLAAAGVGQ